MPFELRALDKRLATLGTDVHTRTMCVQVLAHCSVVPKQLTATLHHRQHNFISSDNTQRNFNRHFLGLLSLAGDLKRPRGKQFVDDDHNNSNSNKWSK